MKKNMFITILLSAILSVSIPLKVNAEIKTDFGTYPDLPYNSSVYLIKHNLGITDSYADLLLIADSTCDINNVQYFAFQNSSSNRMSLVNCPYKFYKLVNGSWTFETTVSSGFTYPTFASFVNSEMATTVPVYSQTYNGYQLQAANTGFITSQIELSFIQTDTNLNITFNDSDDECSRNCVIKYGYNQNDLDNIVDDTPPVKRFNFNIEVLKNGNLYFDVIKDDVVLRSFVYNVTGLVTINGYDYYNIPAGNYQIYLSDLGNSTSGFIYLGKDIDGISNNFSFLDSNGNLLGTQSINYVNPDIIEVDSISGENYDFTSRIKYDFSNYSTTKVISFNHNSNKRLQLFIPSGMYLDYVNIDERENFDCSSDSNINDSIDYNNCYVSFDISDNGNISTVDDNNLSYHIVQDNSNISGFGSKFKNMFTSFTTPFYIIGNIYNVFISNLPVSVMYAIYIGFGLVVFCIFMKIWL